MNGTPAEWPAWVAKAEEDLLCIRNEIAAAQQPWSVICFHAQQAVEKYLKAFLVAQGERPERTHDLGQLLSECVGFEPALASMLPDCDRLTEYAVDVRYPDIGDAIGEQMGRQAVEAAERV